MTNVCNETQPAVPPEIDQMVLAAAARYGTPVSGTIYPSPAAEAQSDISPAERTNKVIQASHPVGEVVVAHSYHVETGIGLGTERYRRSGAVR